MSRENRHWQRDKCGQARCQPPRAFRAVDGRSPLYRRRFLARNPAFRQTGLSCRDRLAFLPELFFDAQELIVFADPVGAAGGTGLDLSGIERDGQVRDERIFGFSGTMGHDARVAGLMRGQYRFNRLRESPDLIHFDEDGIGRPSRRCPSLEYSHW